jgi:hypothetical protein
MIIIPEELAKKVRSELSSNVAEDASILSGGFSQGLFGEIIGKPWDKPSGNLTVCY